GQQYPQAMIDANPEARKAILEKARANYLETSRLSHLLILKYYIEPVDAAAVKYDRNGIDNMTLPDLEKLLARTYARLNERYKNPNLNPARQELKEYEEYIQRAGDRVARIK